MLGPNVIIPFDDTNANVPAGFTRETSLDSKYPKGAAAATNPNTTGGAANHIHTSPGHTHTMGNHTHDVTLNAWNSTLLASNEGSPRTNVIDNHTHTGTSGNPTGGTTDSTAVTYDTVSNDPPFYEVIFIKSGGFSLIPVNGMILHQLTSRDGLSAHAASADKYLKGASAGADAGGTGGTTTNTHNITHTHGVNTHVHSVTTGGVSETNRHVKAGQNNYMGDHTHSFSLNATAAPIDEFTGNLVTVETVEPAHRTLNSYINDGASKVPPQPGDIAMYLGSLSTIPIGWLLCDGANGTPDMQSKFLKIPATPASTTTGGSNAHTHANQSHAHTSSDHGHTADDQSGPTQQTDGDALVTDGSRVPGLHTVTVDDASATYDSANTSADSANNEPEFRTVVYIQFAFSIGGASLFALL